MGENKRGDKSAMSAKAHVSKRIAEGTQEAYNEVEKVRRWKLRLELS
jgi:hypothetical protein